nr:RNA polymerase beta subunit [Dryopteris crassirhizoma]
MNIFLIEDESQFITLLGGSENMPVLPELTQIQFEGFNRFVHERLLEELENFPKIEDTDKEVEF